MFVVVAAAVVAFVAAVVASVLNAAGVEELIVRTLLGKLWILYVELSRMTVLYGKSSSFLSESRMQATQIDPKERPSEGRIEL